MPSPNRARTRSGYARSSRPNTRSDGVTRGPRRGGGTEAVEGRHERGQPIPLVRQHLPAARRDAVVGAAARVVVARARGLLDETVLHQQREAAIERAGADADGPAGRARTAWIAA